MRPRPTAEDRLRALASGQVPVLETLAQMRVDNLEQSELDEDTYRLVRLAALVAADAGPVSYLAHLRVGGPRIPSEMILGTLVAIAPLVGSVRVLSAAARLAEAGLITADLDPSLAGHG
jgi:4-carboxymuconolactone decarboxylase